MAHHNLENLVFGKRNRQVIKTNVLPIDEEE